MNRLPAFILGSAIVLGAAFSPKLAHAFDATQPAAASATTAQATTPGADRGERHGGFAALNLTDAQKAQMKSIHEATQTKIMALLTPDQRAQLQSAQNAQTTQNNGSPAGGRHGFGWMRALRTLNLNDQQRQQVRSIMQDQRQQMLAVLTPDQRAKLQSMAHRRPSGAPGNQQ